MILYRKSTKLNQSVLKTADVPLASAALTFARRGAWIPPLILITSLMYLSGGFPAVFSGVLESPFQRACEESNIMNVWHESVPERAGEATSDLALPGCTVGLGLGQFHFVDAREFAYFERPARARAQLATSPAELTPNVPILFTFTLRDYQGNPVQGLVLDHNRIIHVVITSKDFSVFSHIHVEDSGPVTSEMLKTAEFPVHYTFPKPGQYMVAVDYTERAYLFSDQFYLNVGPSGKMSAPETENFSLRENIDGYDVSLKTSPGSLKANAPATLDYHIEKDGKPLTEMNPYLAVPMHISIVRDDSLWGSLSTSTGSFQFHSLTNFWARASMRHTFSSPINSVRISVRQPIFQFPVSRHLPYHLRRIQRCRQSRRDPIYGEGGINLLVR